MKHHPFSHTSFTRTVRSLALLAFLSTISYQLSASPVPWSDIGARAGADYHGDGLSVTPSGNSARLRCAFQQLEGEATAEGLWLRSTVTNAVHDRVRVVASSVGRLPQKATKETESSFSLFASLKMAKEDGLQKRIAS